MPLARPLLFAFLAVLVVGPAAACVGELVRDPGGWAAWREADRLLALAGNTLALAGLTAAAAVPLGTAAAVVVERVAVPGAGAVRAAAAVGLFVPLPVYAVAWQAVLGSWLPAVTLAPGEVVWRPWAEGLLPAAGVHAAAAVPWAFWIASAGLRRADRGLEDEAAAAGGPAAVARLVLLPRLVTAMLAAAGWAAAQTATEIPITDAMLVRTFAEEAYTQAVAFPNGVAGAVAVAVPAWLIAVMVAGAAVRPVARRFFPADAEPGPPRPLAVATGWRWAMAATVWFGVAVFAGLPLAAVVWKAGGGADGWAGGTIATHLSRAVRLHAVTIADSYLAAVAAGVIAAGLAVAACWAARRHRGWSGVLLVLSVTAWLAPGPLVGLGLKEVIARLVDLEEKGMKRLGVELTFPPVRSALYDQPSPLPGVWAAVARFFPVAVAVVWPVVRAVPRELEEAAALDGAGPWGRFRLAGWPLVRRAAGPAAAAAAALALGEVSASKLVVPPGRRDYILELFAQSHYGADATVAAMCLVQLAVTAAGTAVVLRAVSGAGTGTPLAGRS
jgi:iron(III) transport system permease protein